MKEVYACPRGYRNAEAVEKERWRIVEKEGGKPVEEGGDGKAAGSKGGSSVVEIVQADDTGIEAQEVDSKYSRTC